MQPERIATYRLQLRNGFTLLQAAGLAPYLSELGVSHLYTSPLLQAAAGSTHGYDVVDPGRIDEELGGEAGWDRLCESLEASGLGHMCDLVPNHMAIAGKQNPWWWDVLENGPASRYATYFDVDWEASDDRWPNKVLLPVLGDHYGRILEDHQLHLSHSEGILVLHCHDRIFPVDPSSLAGLINRAAQSCGSDFLAFLAASHARLPRPSVTVRELVDRRHRDKTVLSELLSRVCREDPGAAAAMDDEIRSLNSDPDALDTLIEQQNYRLAFWRSASRDLGYRRFFDINDLAALRVEEAEVFEASHALPISWVREGRVHGLRVDHPDGLKEPAEYFRRLRESCPEAWIVAEKILEEDEKLPADWPIAGTTGYDFLNLAGGLFIDPDGEAELTRLYDEFTGESVDYGEVIRDCKRLVLTGLLGGDLSRLASLFVDICERHRRHRDYTRHELRESLFEAAVWFPVYRSYVSAAGDSMSEDDERYIHAAISGAGADRPDLDPELLRFLEQLLLLKIPGKLEAEFSMRFQQLTGPVMAKGVEDTAFYRYSRLIALNEVGGNPARFATTAEEFHTACREAQGRHPFSLLAATTHDTKRSEDVRARLALLSEIPRKWADAVRRWSDLNTRHRDGELPDRNTEYLIYQTLAGAWPISVERLAEYMLKAVREAKLHTSWTQQNEQYEKSIHGFLEAIMEDAEFIRDLESFVEDLVQPGRMNSLSQTLLRLTAPGVPDIYQGTELWDLSLVDPDNRRPVDFDNRRRLLKELVHLSPEDILQRMDEGLPKMWLIRQALHLRRRQPECFGQQGAYTPLEVEGEQSGHAIALMRGTEVAAVAPRLPMRLKNSWGDTVVHLPPGNWHNVLNGDTEQGGEVSLASILSRFPVALMERRD